ncbi:MAG: acyl-CoA dehydrogenase [Halieaceae bacterium]|nr:acyl-CoA dehydrogenase [Halieaceae bacterium]
MSVSPYPTCEERIMIRQAIRSLVSEFWPLENMEHMTERANDPGKFHELNRMLAEQGSLLMGTEPAYGGWRDILAVMEEMGRVGVPSAFLSAVLANLALSGCEAAEQLVEDIGTGVAVVSWVLPIGADTVSVEEYGGTWRGKAECIEHAGVSSHIAVLQGGGRLAVFDRDSDAIEVSTTPSLSDPHWSSVAMEDATPLFEIDLVAELSTELLQLAQLGMLARALGAAARGFEQATDYAKERRQFGQPIGRFQAVQHKLANSFIELTGVRLLLDGAAESHDAGESRWLPLAQAAKAFGSSALRQVALENHHVLGAIGYSDEHEATHQFRRIHSDTLCLGGPLQANAGLASYLLDQGCTMPDYDLGEAGNAKREEIRAWLNTNWDAGQGGSDSDARKLLGSNGLISFAWPTKFGGTGATPVEEMALQEAFEEAEVPETAYASPQIQAHAIMAFGSVEQQAEFLPKLASGEVQFCLGYSEPGSGSDLASLRTTAVLDGDDWVVNGEKIWTTLAESADYMWLAARTDPEAKAPHAGISIFIVPMDSPGMTVRPSLALYGKTFCHEFLDDVRVPGDALVGELNGGWTVLTAALAVERSIMGGYVSKVRKKFSYLCKAVRDNPRLASNFQVRDRIGRMAAEIEVSRRLYVAALQIAEQGNVPIVEASMSGVFNSELMERLGEMALDILGPRAVLSKDSDGAVAGDLEQMLRHAIMMVVGGGTNEIQRNLIAQRGLGLPR